MPCRKWNDFAESGQNNYIQHFLTILKPIVILKSTHLLYQHISYCASAMPNQTVSTVSHSEKCFSFKFWCCFVSLSLTDVPVSTIFCSIPSWATMLSIAGTSSHETGFCPPLSLHKHRRIKRQK